jgi:hypothetical protein
VQSSSDVVAVDVVTDATAKAATVTVQSGGGADAKLRLAEFGGNAFDVFNDASLGRLVVHDGTSQLLSVSPTSGDLEVKGSVASAGTNGPVLGASGVSRAQALSDVTSISSASGQDILISPGGSSIVHVSTALRVADISLESNTVATTVSNQDLNISPSGSGKILMNGNVQLTTHASSCSSTTRGMFFFQEEVVSGGDVLYICMKKSSGGYGFVQVANQ